MHMVDNECPSFGPELQHPTQIKYSLWITIPGWHIGKSVYPKLGVQSTPQQISSDWGLGRGTVESCDTGMEVSPLGRLCYTRLCRIYFLHLYFYNRILILHGTTTCPDKIQHSLASLVVKHSHFKGKDLEGTYLLSLALLFFFPKTQIDAGGV